MTRAGALHCMRETWRETGAGPPGMNAQSTGSCTCGYLPVLACASQSTMAMRRESVHVGFYCIVVLLYCRYHNG